MHKSTKSGFTLLELLIVVGIIATLSTVSVIVLNPSEVIAKSRDAQRISDLTTLKKAIGLYMVSTPNPKLAGADNIGCKGTAFGSTWQLDTDHIYYSLPTESGIITGKALDGVTFTTGGPSQVSKANLGKVDGNGWLPINFTTMSGGSPISALPVDPVNTIADLANPSNTDHVYRYICNEKDLTYEIHATLESTAYTVTDNKMAKDGGTSDNYYEVGTALNLLTTEGAGGGTAYTSGPLSPGTVVDDGSFGSVAWNNPNNAKVSDNSYATATQSSTTTHYLKGTNFGFAIPSGAIIKGIVAEIERSYSGSDPMNPIDARVRIVKSNGLIGSTDKISGSTWPISDSYQLYGSSSDLWGETWTYSDINNSNFGFVISASTEGPFGADIAQIDHIRMTVYYTN